MRGIWDGIWEYEKGIWEVSGRYLGGVWEISGRYLGGIWDVSERYLGYLGSQGVLSHLCSDFAVKLKEKCKSSFEISILRWVFEGRCHKVL